jgi:hypothetical protein
MTDQLQGMFRLEKELAEKELACQHILSPPLFLPPNEKADCRLHGDRVVRTS